jgi:osmotically inducible protein OsmC
MAVKMRKAGVMWDGDLKTGKGIISTESKALFEHPYTYAMRFGEENGTNPEELIAAAHAACYSMAFAGTLKRNGYDPVRLATNATCIMGPKEGGGFEITKMQLHVRGQVPGITEDQFKQLSKEADKGCPVSNLLRSGLEIELDVELIESFVTTEA